MPKVAIEVEFDRKEIDAILIEAARKSVESPNKVPQGAIKLHFDIHQNANTDGELIGVTVEFCGVGNRADKG